MGNTIAAKNLPSLRNYKKLDKSIKYVEKVSKAPPTHTSFAKSLRDFNKANPDVEVAAAKSTTERSDVLLKNLETVRVHSSGTTTAGTTERQLPQFRKPTEPTFNFVAEKDVPHGRLSNAMIVRLLDDYRKATSKSESVKNLSKKFGINEADCQNLTDYFANFQLVQEGKPSYVHNEDVELDFQSQFPTLARLFSGSKGENEAVVPVTDSLKRPVQPIPSEEVKNTKDKKI